MADVYDEAQHDLGQTIRAARRLLDATPDDHVARARRLRELAILLWNRGPGLDTFDEAIQLKRQALDITPKDLHEATHLSDLASLNYERYFLSSSISHIEESIKWLRGAVELSDSPHNRAYLLADLGHALYCRFKRTRTACWIRIGIRDGHKRAQDRVEDLYQPSKSDQESMCEAMVDLEEAIRVYTQAAALVQADYAYRPEWVFHIGILYEERHCETHSLKDIEDAISFVRESLDARGTSDAGVPSFLGVCLVARHKKTGMVSDIEEAIELQKEAILRESARGSDVCSSDTGVSSTTFTQVPPRTLQPYLQNLAVSLLRLYKTTGAIQDLDKAVEIARQAVALLSSDLDSVETSGFLAHVLLHRYKRTKVRTDLDEAIEMSRRVADLLFFQDHNHARPGHSPFRNLFSQWWQHRTGALISNDCPIEAQATVSLAYIIIGRSSQASSLEDLKTVLYDRFREIGWAEDLAEVVQILRKLVGITLTSLGLLNLGFSLLELYDETKDGNAADEAAEVSNKLALFDATHARLHGDLHYHFLASELSLRFLISGDIAHLTKAMEIASRSVQKTAGDYRSRVVAHLDLGHLHYLKFCTTRARVDLEGALEYSQDASAMMADDDVLRGQSQYYTSQTLFQQYQYTLASTELDEAIYIGRQAVDASSDVPYIQERALDGLATVLYQRYLISSTLVDLEDAILLSRRAVERLTRSAHKGYPYTINLASLLCERYAITNASADLSDAIKLRNQAVGSLHFLQKPHPNFAHIPCHFGSNMPLVFYVMVGRQPARFSIQSCRDALGAATEAGDPSIARHSSNLQMALNLGLGGLIYEKGASTDFDEPVRIGREAIDLSRPEDLSWHLCCLAISLQARVSRIKSSEALAEMINLGQRAVAMAPRDHPGRPFYLLVNAFGLQCRYAHTGRLSDLDGCIRLGLRAWSLALRGDKLGDCHHQFLCAANLADWLRDRYLRHGAHSDLKKAVEFRKAASKASASMQSYEGFDHYSMHMGTSNTEDTHTPDNESIHITPCSMSDRLTWLHNMAFEWYELFNQLKTLSCLSEAIDACECLVDATPLKHLARPGRLELLGNCRRARYVNTKNTDSSSESAMEDLTIAVDRFEEVISTASQANPAPDSVLHSLGPLYNDRYLHSHDLGNLQMSILVLQESVDATPRAHAMRPARLQCLGTAKRNNHVAFGKIEDLDAAISLFQEAIDTTAQGCSSRSGYLLDLAGSYFIKYESIKNIDDLDVSIQLYCNGIEAWPKDDDHLGSHRGRTKAFSGLGQAYVERYKFSSTNPDLEKSILAAHRAMEESPEETASSILLIVTLANHHLTGYATTQLAAHMDKTNQLLKEAEDVFMKINLGSFSRGHHSECIGVLYAIGESYRKKYDAAGERSDLDAAIRFLGLASKKGPSDTRREVMRQISIAQALISALMIKENWKEACVAAETAVWWIPMTTPRFLDISKSQACLSKYYCLGSDAAALALSAGREVLDAVALLEEGRAVAAIALDQVRVNPFSLQHLKSDERNVLIGLCEQLEISPPIATSGTGDRSTCINVQYKREQKWEEGEQTEIQRAVRRITASRKLDHFIYEYQSRHNQIGLPSEIGGPMREYATEAGYAVMVNVSHRCDAFLVKGVLAKAIPLPKLSREAIQTRVEEGDFTSLTVLEWLWDTIANPVLDALGYTQPPRTAGQWPRIWWIPTGSLSKFPLHAAGRHLSRQHETVIDRVISSYSSSFRALFETTRRSQIKRRSPESKPPTLVSALMVAMEHTPRSTPLPFAGKEVKAVSEACKSMSIHTLQPDQRTRHSVLSLLQDCDIFHFAGHGFSDIADPSKSHLRLQDWIDNPLTVADMITTNLRERTPFLAYLSACGTGQIEEAKHLDEGIHLISACQLAGFRHVIGTLCKVNDAICVDIARITYEGICKGTMEEESVSQGLHDAVRALRDRWRDDVTETASAASRKQRTRRAETSSMQEQYHSHQDDRGWRDASPCDEDEEHYSTVPLQWAPYVHYGC